MSPQKKFTSPMLFKYNFEAEGIDSWLMERLGQSGGMGTNLNDGPCSHQSEGRDKRGWGISIPAGVRGESSWVISTMPWTPLLFTFLTYYTDN